MPRLRVGACRRKFAALVLGEVGAIGKGKVKEREWHTKIESRTWTL